MTDRANRPGSALSKAEKRTAARAARAKARAAAQRRRVLTITAGALAVVAVIALVVWMFVRSDGPTTPAADATPTSAPTAAEFPPLPAGADPALKTKPTVKGGATPTKLEVTTLVEGKGATTQAGQTVTVNYVGVTLADGKEFDSSWKRSQAFPVQNIGQANVIPGWNQGLVGVKVGSRVQLDIPAALAYGDPPQQQGAPAGALRFVVDILDAS